MAVLLLVCGLALLMMAGAVVWYAAGWRQGWFEGPPPIAQNMWPMPGSYSPSWSRRLHERFPIGSSEKGLVQALRREGFEINQSRRQAGYGWAKYPCVYTLTVMWRADGLGRVRELQGGLLNACTRMDRLTPERPVRPIAPPAAEPTLVPGAQSA